MSNTSIALFTAYPRLSGVLPRVELCQLPTPIQRLKDTGGGQAFIKRDDLSAPDFGGNKVRALEFLLGAAKARHATRAVVVGLAGTSMALASALYCKQQSLKVAVLLIAQRPTLDVRRNLLIFEKIGADIRFLGTVPAIPRTLARLMLGGFLSTRKVPYFLNPGSPTAMTGYANMAFELREQIQQGQLPEPDRLYIAMGLRGTATGLLFGLHAAGLKTRLVAVSTAPHVSKDINGVKVKMLERAARLNAFLSKHDPTFPKVNIQIGDFDVVCDEPGQTSVTLLEQGIQQIDEVWEKEGIRLDATWTASAWAAMQRDLSAGRTQKPLFWHTSNTQPAPVNTDGVDYHLLPPRFHHYFEEPTTLINKPIFADH